MDVSAAAAFSTAQAQTQVGSAVATKVLKIAQDQTAQVAQALIESLPTGPASEPGMGECVDCSA